MRPIDAVVVSLWLSEYDAKYPGLGKCLKARENRPLDHVRASNIPTRLPEEPLLLYSELIRDVAQHRTRSKRAREWKIYMPRKANGPVEGAPQADRSSRRDVLKGALVLLGAGVLLQPNGGVSGSAFAQGLNKKKHGRKKKINLPPVNPKITGQLPPK